jgi:hypothetical protein
MVIKIILLVIGVPGVVLAFPLGPFQVTPEVILEQRYDSNIFLTASGEQADLISYGGFSLQVGLPIRITRARRIIPSLTYFAEAAAFADHREENFQNQGITGGLDVDFPLSRPDQRFTFKVTNRLRSVTELLGSAEQSDIGARTRREENLLTADAGYFLSRRDEVHLTYTRVDLDQKRVAEFLDRDENTLGLAYFRRISPRFSALTRYDYKFVEFTNLGPTDPDFSSTGHIITIGLRGDPEARLSGTFRVGAEMRQFKGLTGVIRPFAAATLGYNITPRLVGTLLLTQAIQETTNRDFAFFDATVVQMQFTHKLICTG